MAECIGLCDPEGKKTLAESYAKENPNLLVWIYSGEHDRWWRPKRSGYTSDRWMAGRYLLKDAFEATKHCGPEKRIHFETVIPMSIPWNEPTQ